MSEEVFHVLAFVWLVAISIGVFMLLLKLTYPSNRRARELLRDANLRLKSEASQLKSKIKSTGSGGDDALRNLLSELANRNLEGKKDGG